MITIEKLRELLEYDPLTGHLLNKVNSRGRIKGARVGHVHKASGYRNITLLNKTYKEHIVIWFHYYAILPSLDIDHINRDKQDNRISNLREATRSQNSLNRAITSTMYRGVRSLTKNTYRAEIHIPNTSYKEYLGTYTTPEAASIIYENRAKELQGEFYINPCYTYSLDIPIIQVTLGNTKKLIT